MDIPVLCAFLIGGGLVVGLIAAAARIRSSRVVAGQNGNPDTVGRARRNARAVLWVFGAALVLLIFFNRAYFETGANQVIGSPTRAQVTGTWVGDYALTIVLRPNGTFTTSGLPPHVGTAAPITFSADGDVDVWSGRGTWIVGPGIFNGSPESVIFTVACDAAANGCAGHPRTFDLQMEGNAPAGGGGPALFYYLGNPHDLSNQYPFVRGQ
jgi:hypothetical protein